MLSDYCVTSSLLTVGLLMNKYSRHDKVYYIKDVNNGVATISHSTIYEVVMKNHIIYYNFGIPGVTPLIPESYVDPELDGIHKKSRKLLKELNK